MSKISTFLYFVGGVAFFLSLFYIVSLSPAFSEEYAAERDASIKERNSEMIQNQNKFFGPLE